MRKYRTIPTTGSRITSTTQSSLVPVSALLFRIDTIAMMSRTRMTRPSREDIEDPSLHLFRDRLLLREEVEVFAPAGLRVRPGHVEAAERMNADERSGALAIQVEVSD